MSVEHLDAGELIILPGAADTYTTGEITTGPATSEQSRIQELERRVAELEEENDTLRLYMQASD
jgi:hypothetical protein